MKTVINNSTNPTHRLNYLKCFNSLIEKKQKNIEQYFPIYLELLSQINDKTPEQIKLFNNIYDILTQIYTESGIDSVLKCNLKSSQVTILKNNFLKKIEKRPTIKSLNLTGKPSSPIKNNSTPRSDVNVETPSSRNGYDTPLSVEYNDTSNSEEKNTPKVSTPTIVMSNGSDNPPDAVIIRSRKPTQNDKQNNPEIIKSPVESLNSPTEDIKPSNENINETPKENENEKNNNSEETNNNNIMPDGFQPLKHPDNNEESTEFQPKEINYTNDSRKFAATVSPYTQNNPNHYKKRTFRSTVIYRNPKEDGVEDRLQKLLMNSNAFLESMDQMLEKQNIPKKSPRKERKSTIH